MTIRCELIDELLKEYPHPQGIPAETLRGRGVTVGVMDEVRQ